jgi:hypothetical protein
MACILYLTQMLPFPLDTGAKVRQYAGLYVPVLFLSGMSKNLTLLTFS